MQKSTLSTQQLSVRSASLDATTGFSLIEVLVAIAILSVGILAILILFPAGVSSLQTAAEFTDADRLAQAELERANGAQVQLIGAIYPNTLSGTTAKTNPSTLLTTPATLGLQTDVDYYRQIVGETARVPEPVLDSQTANASQPISLYTVVADPVVASSVTISGMPWQSMSADLSGTGSDLGAGSSSDLVAGQPQYLIDYTRGEILLAPESATTAYAEPIQFTVTGSNGTAVTQYLTITAAQMTSGAALPLTSLAVTTGYGSGNGAEPLIPWVVGSDRLVRNFTQLNSGSAYSYSSFTSDPYQWQYYTSNLVSTTSTPANMGVIAFNPAGAQSHGVNGQPLEAVINYLTYDWHIISEDKYITSPLGSIKLSLGSILSSTGHDKLSNNSTSYTGLFTYSGSGASTSNPDFIVLDLDKGLILTKGTSSTTADYTVNYPTGLVTFINTNGLIVGTTNGSYVNDHLRVFYHPTKDWAVSLIRAPLVYSPWTSTVTPTTKPNIDQYSVASNGTYIAIPLADVGKQVDIRMTYTPPGSTTSITYENLFTVTSPNGYGEVALVDGSGNAFASGTTISQNTLTIKGVSLSSLVIWQENGIWRNQTISTIIQNKPMPAVTTLQ